jgi:hypothetical protein
MNHSVKLLLFISLLVAPHLLVWGQDDAKAIFMRATGQLLTDNMEIKMEMKITDKRGRVKEKGFEVLMAQFGDMKKTRMSWQKPEEAKGTTVIFTELQGETGLIEVFTPSNGKIRKLKATPENMAMVGSEAQISNMTDQDPDELIFDLLPPQETAGKRCYTLVVKDKEREGEARGELLVEMDSYHVVQISIFDKSGKRTSIVKLTNFQPVEGSGSKIQPMRIVTEDLEAHKQTDMQVLSISSRADLKEADFQL